MKLLRATTAKKNGLLNNVIENCEKMRCTQTKVVGRGWIERGSYYQTKENKVVCIRWKLSGLFRQLLYYRNKWPTSTMECNHVFFFFFCWPEPQNEVLVSTVI